MTEVLILADNHCASSGLLVSSNLWGVQMSENVCLCFEFRNYPKMICDIYTIICLTYSSLSMHDTCLWGLLKFLFPCDSYYFASWKIYWQWPCTNTYKMLTWFENTVLKQVWNDNTKQYWFTVTRTRKKWTSTKNSLCSQGNGFHKIEKMSQSNSIIFKLLLLLT